MNPKKDPEIEAMAAIKTALESIDDKEKQQIVLNWAAERFGLTLIAKSKTTEETDTTKGLGDKPYSELGEINDKGGLDLHIRDLKAKNKKDAAFRLFHIIIFLYERLTGEKNVSSKKVVIPLLTEWRLYDGNCRQLMANYQGLKRDGDNLYLDKPAKSEAEKFIKEIKDTTITGKWQQTSIPKTKKRVKSKTTNK